MSVERALGDEVAAARPRLRAEVDDPVGGAHHRLVVLDDEHGVAEVAQALERGDQAVVVRRVQADGRLVADVEHAHQRGADLRGQADALRLAAGEGAGAPVQRQVIDADVARGTSAATAISLRICVAIVISRSVSGVFGPRRRSVHSCASPTDMRASPARCCGRPR